MKLYPLLPVLFILAYLFVGTVIAITNPEYAVTGLSVLAVFIILYFIFHKKNNTDLELILICFSKIKIRRCDVAFLPDTNSFSVYIKFKILPCWFQLFLSRCAYSRS